MKKSVIYSIVITSLLSVGCGEEFLDPVRNTQVITSEELAALAPDNPALIAGTLEGVYSFMVQPGGVLGTSRHYDLGQKGVDIYTDMLSGDMALSANSYGWYQNVANLVTTVDFTREENRIVWNYYYKVINISNAVINNLGGNDAVPADATTRHFMGQAKAARAYAYFYLTQLFQKEYNPTQEILPFYDGVIVSPAKVPASQIYDQIIEDLNQSIEYLSDYTRPLKNQIDKNVAKGLLAYTYAAMGNYSEAKILSEDIINTGGYPLTTTGQLAFPGSGSGFNNVNTPSWMWGYDITNEMGHQLVNWWGQVDYYTYSYQWAGDRKVVDSGLYAAIPSNDIRKSQFGTSGVTNGMPINKFFDPGRAAGGQQAITTDYIFMRIEEFYLLSAECSANSGDEATAKNRLKELMALRLGSLANANAYVDPLVGQALKDAIYLQTRIEFWGEGKSYLALKRNKATSTRGTNHVFRSGQSFFYNTDEMSFQIPENELLNNPAITTQN
ncbi:RagB/SusD family nutrient uptake outer membrane protein [Flavobacterium dankookense]|uniref:SusD-like starch-binding protein associating with outer membrane n=1 Tax=Flavobacterium dankookense TaxID=706186 RepID=A0A4R6Q945_9FLAO|nr:RagB/SusD family nutrient uptake outer membrane protein [Flavobacterium dankookense]TDP58376.1 SusD-like starch-binding protein associating with outer membrane [Flavobacterium dankookense]